MAGSGALLCRSDQPAAVSRAQRRGTGSSDRSGQGRSRVRVGIRVDAGPVIGGGHVMRCLTLANALTERGAEVAFVTAAMPEALRRRIAAAGHGLVERPALPDLDRTGPNWHEPPLGGDVQLEDVKATEAG